MGEMVLLRRVINILWEREGPVAQSYHCSPMGRGSPVAQSVPFLPWEEGSPVAQSVPHSLGESGGMRRRVGPFLPVFSVSFCSFPTVSALPGVLPPSWFKPDSPKHPAGTVRTMLNIVNS